LVKIVLIIGFVLIVNMNFHATINPKLIMFVLFSLLICAFTLQRETQIKQLEQQNSKYQLYSV